MICSDAHTHCHSCWCKLFEWIRIEWIRTGGIRVEDTYWWDMYWWDTFAIPADAHLLNGYVCNGYVLVGYVWNGYVWNGYVWDMYDVLDMYGILVVIGGIRITTFWMDTHCMDTYWWDTYGWDTFGMDMCGICAMCWICVGYVWWIRLEWICVGYVWCAGYVWDMCGVRYANNLLKNPATKRLSGKTRWIVLSCLTPLSLGIEHEKTTRYLVEPNLCNSTWSYTATCCGVDWRPWNYTAFTGLPRGYKSIQPTWKSTWWSGDWEWSIKRVAIADSECLAA